MYQKPAADLQPIQLMVRWTKRPTKNIARSEDPLPFYCCGDPTGSKKIRNKKLKDQK